MSTDLTEFVTVFYSNDSTYKNQFLFHKHKVKFETTEDLTFPQREGFYWIQFQLTNVTSKDQDLVLELGSLGPHYTQLYTLVEDEIDSSRMLGAFVPFSERYFEYRKICFPIKLPSNTDAKYFLYVNKSQETLNVPLTIWTQNSFISLLAKGETQIGIMLWACVLIVIIAFYYVFTIPNRLTIAFGLLTLTILLNLLIQTGLFALYIAPGYPQLAHDLRIMRRILSHTLIWILILEIFEIKKSLSILYTPIRVLIYFLVMGVVIASLEPFFPSIKSLFGLYIASIGISTIGMLLIPLYLFIKRKDVISGLFVLNSVSLLYILYMATIAYVLNYKVNSLWFNDLINYYSFTTSIIFLLAFFYYQWNRTSLNRELKTALEEAKKDALHNLLEGQEIERKRLSQQLHDGISVLLASIRMRLSAHEKSEEFKPIIDDLGVVSKDVRNFSHDLAPVILETYGLEKALEDLTSKIMVSSNPPHISIEGFGNQSLQLNKRVEEYLYFILAELINNSLKHANASSIKIELNATDDIVSVSYYDNGIGLDDKNHHDGRGIKNIKSRVNLMNGKCTWSGASDDGFNFNMLLPIDGTA